MSIQHRTFLKQYSNTVQKRVNRDVLRWIKEWDYCVFGKKPTAESERERAMRQYKNVFGNSAASRKMDITDKVYMYTTESSHAMSKGSSNFKAEG